MNRWMMLASGIVTVGLLSSSLAFGQQPKADCDKSRVPDKVEGQVTRIDPSTSKVTIRDSKGMTHEFQSNPETVKDMKTGDRIEARLRQAPNC
jgi:Cu/Ag efflux protein CusF